MRRMSMRVVSALSFRKGSDASSGSSGESAIGSGISTSSTGGVAAASPKGLRRMSMRIKAVLVSFFFLRDFYASSAQAPFAKKVCLSEARFFR